MSLLTQLIDSALYKTCRFVKITGTILDRPYAFKDLAAIVANSYAYVISS